MRNAPITVITLTAAGVFGYTLIHAVYYVPDNGTFTPTSTSSRTALPVEMPARLSIPALGIDAAVQHVGVKKDGSMGVPSNFTDVAWYKYGTAPGQQGSAVIDGHVDNGLSLPGVFKHLSNIKVGNDVYLTTESGRQLHFRVVETDAYPYQSVPLDRLFNRSDAARLNLITCTGTWVADGKTYDERYVVYTELLD